MGYGPLIQLCVQSASMKLWHLITSFGDAGLMVPAALVITIWLYLAEGKAPAILWASLFCAAGFVVILTKIAFLGYGIGIHRLDFTGISGHSMMSMAVFPVAFLLLGGPANPWRGLFLLLGGAFALLVAFSRLSVRVHSPSEVVAGVALGATVAALFVFLAKLPEQRMRSASFAALSLGVIFLADFGRPAPTQDIISRISVTLSGRDHPYSRAEWWAEGIRRSDAQPH